MNQKVVWAALVALPLAVGGLAYATAATQTHDQTRQAEAFICPATGEELPCPNCCPLKQ
jgi:hypothetical protein